MLSRLQRCQGGDHEVERVCSVGWRLRWDRVVHAAQLATRHASRHTAHVSSSDQVVDRDRLRLRLLSAALDLARRAGPGARVLVADAEGWAIDARTSDGGRATGVVRLATAEERGS